MARPKENELVASVFGVDQLGGRLVTALIVLESPSGCTADSPLLPLCASSQETA